MGTGSNIRRRTPAGPILHPLLRRRLLAVLIATAGAGLVWFGLQQVSMRRGEPGRTAPVLVLTEAVSIDAEISPHAEVRHRPIAHLPDGAPTHPDEITGARARVPLPAGTVLTNDLLTVDASSRRDRVAVRSDPHTIPLEPDDEVAIWATFDPAFGDGRADTARITEGAVVVSADADRTVLAVRPDDTRAVVEALVLGTVTLVRSPR